MIKEFEIGEEIILRVRFKNRFGVYANPTVVTGAVKPPTGGNVALAFVNTGTVGEYEAPFTPTMDGKHWWRARGAGVVDTTEQRAFRVNKQKVTIP